MNMATEIRLLKQLSRNPGSRPSHLGNALGIPGKDALELLEQLRRDGMASRDLNMRWSLSSRGEQILAGYISLTQEGPLAANRRGVGDDGTPDSASKESVRPLPEPLGPVPPEAEAEDETVREAVRAADARACLLVCAGPGMGKTHLACERIKALVSSGVAPHRILVISFSRAAVRVMRERAGSVGGASRALEGVGFRTLDSLGAMLHGERSFDNYRASIERAIETRERWAPGVRGKWEHVIVDEAQDVIGVRAALVCALLEEISSAERPAGFTVLHDPAQAIYDFTRDDEDSRDLVRRMRDRGLVDSRHDHTLSVVHRSSEPELLELMARARPDVLRADSEALDRLGGLLDEASHRFDWSVDPRGELWLFRSRAEVASAIYWLCCKGVRHRVRVQMKGAGHELDPDIARILGGCPWPLVEREDVLASAQRLRIWPARARELFDAMLGLAAVGEQRIDARRLVCALARPGRVPVEFEEPVQKGDVTVSVVHSAKGTEADVVRYFRRRGAPIKEKEEARVAYVSISRARKELHVHELLGGPIIRHRRNRGSERAWFKMGHKGARRALICGPDDVDDHRGLGIYLGEDEGIQRRLAAFGGAPEPVRARREGRRFMLFRESDGEPVGALAERVSEDFERFFKDLFNEFDCLEGLHWIGVRTVASSPDLSARGPLRAPFHRTRIWLAPVVVGLARRSRVERETSARQGE